MRIKKMKINHKMYKELRIYDSKDLLQYLRAIVVELNSRRTGFDMVFKIHKTK